MGSDPPATRWKETFSAPMPPGQLGRWARSVSEVGLRFDGASGNVIGGTSLGAGNVISATLGFGVEIGDSASTGNLIEGNLIGTDATGTLAAGNEGDGVYLSSAGNTVGGTVAGAGNLIADNFGMGSSSQETPLPATASAPIGSMRTAGKPSTWAAMASPRTPLLGVPVPIISRITRWWSQRLMDNLRAS